MLEIILVVMVDMWILMLSTEVGWPQSNKGWWSWRKCESWCGPNVVIVDMWILSWFSSSCPDVGWPQSNKGWWSWCRISAGSVEQIYWCPTGLRCHHEDLSCKGLQKFFFSKTVSICKKKCKKSLHRSALPGWDVTRRINVAKMCFLFYFIISNLHHDVIFANMGTVKIEISSLNS